MKEVILRALTVLAISAVLPSAAWTQRVVREAAVRCQDLERTDFSHVPDASGHVSLSQVVDAHDGIPAYCQVRGHVSPQINFELRLPTNNWNGKFMEVGGGGWCGIVNAGACDNPIRRGYACIASDTGHTGSPFDVRWADQNLQGLVDFGYRAVHVAVVAGKAIAEQFYQAVPDRSYFVGCSTGGYQGVMAAQRFPWDFDGIVAGAPDIDGAAANLRGTWIPRVKLDVLGHDLLGPVQLKLLHDAALAACDLDNGVKDGIIGNPPSCRFDPKTLACKPGSAAGCLNAAQVDAATKLYAGPMNSAGERISTGGFLVGSELGWDQNWPTSSLEDFFRYGIPGYSLDPQWKYTDFDFDRDYQRFGLAAYYDNTNPDLRKFKKAGGKLIIYHGWTDTIDLPGAVTDYYETVERTMGGRRNTQDFFRLFMVPGMNHCGGGAGALDVDWLTYLEDWVEKGKAPAVIVGVHVDKASTRPAFTRPLYPYPAYARYKGTGDPDKAEDFAPAGRN